MATRVKSIGMAGVSAVLFGRAFDLRIHGGRRFEDNIFRLGINVPVDVEISLLNVYNRIARSIGSFTNETVALAGDACVHGYKIQAVRGAITDWFHGAGDFIAINGNIDWKQRRKQRMN
jgi:hypothetical protein